MSRRRKAFGGEAVIGILYGMWKGLQWGLHWIPAHKGIAVGGGIAILLLVAWLLKL